MKILSFFVLVGLLLAAFAGVMWFIKSVDRSFVSLAQGLSFKYPQEYSVIDFTEGSGSILFRAVVRKSEDALVKPRQGELPPEIRVIGYYRDSKATLSQWLTINRETYWALSRGDTKNIVKNGVPGIEFAWSGLYEGKAVALDTGDLVVVIAGEYISTDDNMLNAWERVVETFKFDKR